MFLNLPFVFSQWLSKVSPFSGTVEKKSQSSVEYSHILNTVNIPKFFHC